MRCSNDDVHGSWARYSDVTSAAWPLHSQLPSASVSFREIYNIVYMPSEKLVSLCNDARTIASELERDATAGPGAVATKLFPHIKSGRAPAPVARVWEDYTIADLDSAERCGKFGKRPSDLFLRMYSDVLDTLEHDPLNGMCAPSLMGSSGYIPISMVSL
jgi:hypothetical protein